jgi:hypothetical protein
MSLVNDKDARVYTLSGNTGVVKPGERITVEGRRKGALTYEVQSLVKDFGVCQPENSITPESKERSLDGGDTTPID